MLNHWKELRWWEKIFAVDLPSRLLFRHNSGIRVVTEEWDNLIILDACRYDTFRALLHRGPECGILESRVSLGTTTTEFLEMNFGNEIYKNIVYITANPNINHHWKHKFHDIVPLWRDYWDEENHTVLPDIVAGFGLQARSKYPDKRIIIHFLQPHAPFLGVNTNEARLLSLGKLIPVYAPRMISSETEYRSFTEEEVKTFYERNLRLVIPIAMELARNLGGKTVITSDHGEALGERMLPGFPLRLFGHFRQVRIPSLALVPWMKVRASASPSALQPASPIQNQPNREDDDEVLESRLKALGYL